MVRDCWWQLLRIKRFIDGPDLGGSAVVFSGPKRVQSFQVLYFFGLPFFFFFLVCRVMQNILEESNTMSMKLSYTQPDSLLSFKWSLTTLWPTRWQHILSSIWPVILFFKVNCLAFKLSKSSFRFLHWTSLDALECPWRLPLWIQRLSLLPFLQSSLHQLKS